MSSRLYELLRELGQEAGRLLSDAVIERLEGLRVELPRRPTRDELVDALAVMGWDDTYRPTLDELGERYRELAQRIHPDKGGSTEAMARLNAAKRTILAAIAPVG